MPEPDEDGDAPSLFEELLEEAAGPFVTVLAGQEVVVEVPTADDVCALDDGGGPVDVLDLLAGDDVTDEVLDLLDDRPGSELVELVRALRAHFAVLHPPREGFTAVVEQIDLYGEAIEADLVFSGSGLVLLDWFRDHERYPWSLLLRLLARMPEAGHYETARRDDDELAEQIAELRRRGQLPAASRPQLLGWTRDRETLTAILEALRRVEHATWSASTKVKGKGRRPPKNLPRPQTAADRVAEQELLVEHDELATALLGDRYQPRFSTAPGEREPSPSVIRGGVLLGQPNDTT